MRRRHWREIVGHNETVITTFLSSYQKSPYCPDNWDKYSNAKLADDERTMMAGVFSRCRVHGWFRPHVTGQGFLNFHSIYPVGTDEIPDRIFETDRKEYYVAREPDFVPEEEGWLN